MSQTDREVLATALFHLQKAESHAAHGLADEIVIDACALRLIAMLDALTRLPDASLINIFSDEWPLMRGMRNRLVHGYATVDQRIIEATIREELPQMRRVIEHELDIDRH